MSKLKTPTSTPAVKHIMALSLFLNLIENSPPRKVEKNVAIENITASINSQAPR
jgi:hypothetical protein